YFKIGVAAAAIDDAVIVAGRDLNAGAGYSFLRRYAGESGDVEWTYNLGEDVAVSDIVATEGGVVVVGSLANNGTTRAWVHMLNVDGTPIWDAPEIWLNNTEATSVAIAANGDLYVAGDLTVEDGIEHTDVFVWHLPAKAMPTWATWDSGESLTPNDYANDIVIDGEGRVFVAGAATFPIPNFEDYRRMSVLEYSDATLALRWGDRKQDTSESRVLGISNVGNDIALAGWSSETPDSPLVLEVLRIHENDKNDPFSTIWTYTDEGMMARFASGIVQDPNGRLVVAGTISGSSDVLETLVLDSDGIKAWSADYQNFAGGQASASAVAIDQFGYVYFAGNLSAPDRAVA
ncbi:MAG: hypothetical protein KC468_38080, partial [Myxococcales bacterium]|nr:hypothetical protein [Myxococcales bacterium]